MWFAWRLNEYFATKYTNKSNNNKTTKIQKRKQKCQYSDNNHGSSDFFIISLKDQTAFCLIYTDVILERYIYKI